jgi:hypothetical protein
MEDITDKGWQRPVVIGFLTVLSFPRRTNGRTALFVDPLRLLDRALRLRARDTAAAT